MIYWFLNVILLTVVSAFTYKGETVLVATFLGPNLQLRFCSLTRTKSAFSLIFNIPLHIP